MMSFVTRGWGAGVCAIQAEYAGWYFLVYVLGGRGGNGLTLTLTLTPILTLTLTLTA